MHKHFNGKWMNSCSDPLLQLQQTSGLEVLHVGFQVAPKPKVTAIEIRTVWRPFSRLEPAMPDRQADAPATTPRTQWSNNGCVHLSNLAPCCSRAWRHSGCRSKDRSATRRHPGAEITAEKAEVDEQRSIRRGERTDVETECTKHARSNSEQSDIKFHEGGTSVKQKIEAKNEFSARRPERRLHTSRLDGVLQVLYYKRSLFYIYVLYKICCFKYEEKRAECCESILK